VICPICGHENLQGLDECANCGADLRTVDIPHPGNEFEAVLVREQLRDLEDGDVIRVAETTPVVDVIRQMQELSIGSALVVDGDRLTGIFTERDALVKVAGRPLDGVTVGAVMTPDPVVLRAQDSVAVALNKMAVGGFRHIPLVDGAEPTGVISARDLFRYLVTILDEPA
jgi:CBS domain-containing protein